MNPNTGFWNTGVMDVPRITGTTPAVMDCHEVRDICAQLGIALPFPSLLDVGCGTGRCYQLAGLYRGVDISPSAVRYGQERGLQVSLIDGPDSLDAFASDSSDWVLAWSVFTHIGRPEQVAYLAQFARIAPHVLVDILPDDPGRTAARWGCDAAVFRQDMEAAGYAISPVEPELVDRQGWARHRYFRGTRR